jgi:hypothetical protein
MLKTHLSHENILKRPQIQPFPHRSIEEKLCRKPHCEPLIKRHISWYLLVVHLQNGIKDGA